MLLRQVSAIAGLSWMSWACGGGDSATDDAGSGASGGGGSGGQVAAAVAITEADCVAPPNARAEWLGAHEDGVSCQVTCTAGHADCDGQRDNGCETDTSDAAACTRCVDSCLTDLCGGGPGTCGSYRASVWTLQSELAGGRVRDVAVDREGRVFARLNAPRLETGMPDLPAVSPGALLSTVAEGPLWQTSAGDPSLSNLTDATLTTDSRIIATRAGLYVADLYRAADVGGQHYASSQGDVLLSLVSPAGALLWARSIVLPGGGNVAGLFGDEIGNAYVQVYTDQDLEYEGQSVQVPASGGYVDFAFSTAGDLRWLAAGPAPISVQPVSGGLFATRGALTGPLLSSATGKSAGTLGQGSAGAQMIAATGDSSLIVAGTVASSDLAQHGGLPGLSGVSVDPGSSATPQSALFVQKLGPDGKLIWETHFASSLRLTLYQLQLAADGTVYVLASGNPGSELAPGSERVFVARVASDGQQQGAFRFDAQAPRGAALALGADGTLHVGAHYSGSATLDMPITGSGLIGVDLTFTPL